MIRVPALALLACFLLGLAGSYPIERIMRSRIRQEMRAWIRSGAHTPDVETLTFPLRHGVVADARFSWEEENEFQVNGEWFDVVDKVVQGDRITFHCLRDGKEARVIARFAALNASSRSDDRQGTQELVHLITQRYLPQDATSSCPAPVGIRLLFALERPAKELPSLLVPPAPPPRVAA